jgi:phosphoribosylanthranilate isomerase
MAKHAAMYLFTKKNNENLMDQKVKIKLGNITNLSDARFAAAAGIDYMGFCFDVKSFNYIPPVKAKELIDWTSGCFIVAEFGNQTIKEISDICEMLNIDVVEINNDLFPSELAELDKPIVKKIDTSLFDFNALNIILNNYSDKVDAFHLYNSFEKNNINEAQLKTICANYKIFWGFDTAPENIKETLATYQPYALNIIGGNEEKTGLKDFDELNNILDVLGMYEN